MSNKQGKKRKASGILHYEEVKANVARKNDYLCDVREKLQALKSVDLNRLMADRCSLTEDEALHLLACKISFAGVYNLRTALGHVPENITQVLTRNSLASDYYFEPKAHLRGSRMSLLSKRIEKTFISSLSCLPFI